MKARCSKCGQAFKLLEEPPIDDETIFGWVTEDDPGGSSVLSGTGIFSNSFHESTQVPVHNRWVHPPPPAEPRVELVTVDDSGVTFCFPVDRLRDIGMRMSFPHRCAQCLGREDLEVHLIIWPEKVPLRDAAMIQETETRSHRNLQRLMQSRGLNWFEGLERIPTLPQPFNEPFPFCICPHCSVFGAIRGRVYMQGAQEMCQLIVGHPSLALEFYRNNGGRDSPGYKRLLVASRQRRDNQWQALAVGIRIKLGQWFTPKADERFLGYFADRDFAKTERGTAGLVMTDKRMVYHKYAALREYTLEEGGTLEIEATRAIANVEITQANRKPAILATTPLAASSLARTLTGLKKPWQINVTTQT
jgi:hypothetical protein